MKLCPNYTKIVIFLLLNILLSLLRLISGGNFDIIIIGLGVALFYLNYLKNNPFSIGDKVNSGLLNITNFLLVIQITQAVINIFLNGPELPSHSYILECFINSANCSSRDDWVGSCPEDASNLSTPQSVSDNSSLESTQIFEVVPEGRNDQQLNVNNLPESNKIFTLPIKLSLLCTSFNFLVTFYNFYKTGLIDSTPISISNPVTAVSSIPVDVNTFKEDTVGFLKDWTLAFVGIQGGVYMSIKQNLRRYDKYAPSKLLNIYRGIEFDYSNLKSLKNPFSFNAIVEPLSIQLQRFILKNSLNLGIGIHFGTQVVSYLVKVLL